MLNLFNYFRSVCGLVRGRHLRKLHFHISIIVFMLPSISFAGFTLNGECFTDDAAVLEAYIQSYPQTSGGLVLDLVSAVPATNTISYTVNSTNLADGKIKNVSGTINLQACDYDTAGWDQVQSSGLMFYGLMVLMFFIGVRMGFLL